MACSLRRLATIVISILAIVAIVVVRSRVFADAKSQEGCINQWLFNGAWRVQVTKVDPYLNGNQQVGWQVTEVWRNGTTQEIDPSESELQDQKLTLDNGSMLASASTAGGASLSTIASHDFAPAAQFTFTQVFTAPNLDASNKPKAVDVIFNGEKLAMYKATGARGIHPQFTTPRYNFHFKLDCAASGAAAQSQGGATQVAALPGCMNQWLTNGVWKIRATAIAPDNNNDPTSPQIGWMISEDWVNMTGRALAPGDSFDTDQYLVTASGNNTPSSNSVGTSLNKQQLDFHTFAPGGSFTYQQRFRWSPLDASDKPVRLLVTFDAAQENKNPNRPHYKTPANFRIDLTCSK
ncbi:MAG: hypothetical protein JO009_06395 [Candidatus Eremiobacteraeota bacterium]|nr:hypothetical protein [Candidatus Eremiobacteraeota bacterium]